MANSEFVKRTVYGNKAAARTDVVLISPHDGEWRPFFELYPELLTICPARKETLETFLKIEEDFGASELVAEIAKYIGKASNNLRIDIIEILLPRSVIDGNRVTEKAVRHIFNHHDHSDLVHVFQELHRGVVNTIQNYLKELSPGGIVIDVHTMAPYDPNKSNKATATEAISETPDNLPLYIDGYINRRKYGQRRVLDLITQTADKETLADLKLAEILEKSLQKYQFTTKRNDPYPYSEYTLSTRYVRQYQGIAIDIPKDYLSIRKAEEEGFDLANLEIDFYKLNILAEAIGTAVVVYFGKNKGREI
jgi:hypothetical protein